MPEMKQDRLALDRASIRTVDPASGHLHVGSTNISKANICEYYSEEIPDAERLGLKPGQRYKLLRDPAELAKAAPSFNGKPLLIIHKPQIADQHDHKVVVGSVSNVTFNKPYLQAELAVWDQNAIDLIESNEQRELSCGYFYRADMSGGTYEGESYDGRMVDINGNHVALVTEGRAGPDVFVGDAKPPEQIPETIPAPTPDASPVRPSPYQNKEILMAKSAALSRTAVLATGALTAYLLPKMAADQKINLAPVLKNVTAKNWKSQKPKIKVALDAALKDKLAEDADISDIIDMLDQLEEMADEDVQSAAVDADPDADEDDDEETKKEKAKEAAEKLKEAAEDEKDDDDDDDDKKKPAFLKDKKGARDKAAKDKAAQDSVPMVSVAAMDAALAAMRKSTESSTIARLRAIQEAEKAVRPYIGELAMASDSAEDIYRLALDHAGIDLDGVPAAAFPAMVKMLPKPGEVAPVKVARMAADASTLADAKTRFPGLAALKQR